MKKQTKWLDNFGKADNANESNVSLSENFNGLAYDTTGRNYSPAWGGQFQQGGSIPGSVGFTYARTGSTPSEGKYAKKTLPSAQNGREMQYYQEGLDWKPKSMQDGGNMVIDRELKNTPVVIPIQPQQQSTSPEKSWARKFEDFIGESKKFLAENVSDPLTTLGLNIVNQVEPLDREKIYNTVRPIDYPNAGKLPKHAYNYIMGNKTEPLKTKSGKPHISEEFWARAMGVPIEDGYLKESEYKPSLSKNTDAKYYTIRDIIDQEALMRLTKNMKPGEKLMMNGLGEILRDDWYAENAHTDKGVKFDDLDPLQRFTIQKNDDNSYVSIYDKYDFDNPALNRMMEPIEIYDRFYLDKPKSKLLPSSPSKKKDGGIIKDNQGYWNPDNWGKPVEIDSNDITMRGVYEPLLGISDTGDVQYMTPGKDYRFKGSKVTEFPVAELGINQLDAQPKKKLNQLLNFTNNPDKTNWLDKYQ